MFYKSLTIARWCRNVLQFNMCYKFYGISAVVGGYIDLWNWNQFWNMIKENCFKESCSIMLQKWDIQLKIGLDSDWHCPLTSRSLCISSELLLEPYSIITIVPVNRYVETNRRPCAMIISSYNNHVLDIPDCHADMEYLASSERHSHSAHVSVIRCIHKIAKNYC